MRFLGKIEAKTDAKGRVFIPATFRRQLQAEGEEGDLIVRMDVHQPCLVLYPQGTWFSLQDDLRGRLSPWNRQEQAVFRQFVSDAEIVTPDANGRILLSRRLLERAGIGNDVLFVGMDNVIEIWAKGRMEQLLLEPDGFSEALQEYTARS